MSVRLPMTYCSTHIGDVRADDELESLSSLNILCRMPKRIYRIASGRPDIIRALLAEDLSLRRSIIPYVLWNNMHLRVAHIALRPTELLPLTLTPRPSHTEIVRCGVIRWGIGRISYVNHDHTDCRLSNLREITETPPCPNPSPDPSP